MTVPDRPTYLLTLRPLPPLEGEPPINVRLRRAEKYLLRCLRLKAIDHRQEEEARLLAAARLLWSLRDTAQEDQDGCRRLYNAWLDLRDALHEIGAIP
jgi:hypothetical protein